MNSLVSASATSAKALVDNAKRLGLQWSLRPGVVSSLGTVTKVKLDGPDTDTQHQVIDLTSGTLTLGTRVQVLILPEAMYIVGFPGGYGNPFPDPTLPMGNAAASAAISAETVLETASNVTVKAGRAVAWEFGLFLTPSVTNFTAFNLRKGNTTAGTLVAFTRFALTGGNTVRVLEKIYFINGTASDYTGDFAWTMATTTGTTTAAASGTRRWWWLRDAGPATNFSGWTSL